MDKTKQMEMLFQEGGIADDGMTVDPVSGNDVPSGSMAEEVRDDIPAQLSEGEYVVPADVVRYYGVKFFEDLRGEAKQGLGQMEVDGRIGGEPVGMEMYEDEGEELSPEELEELTNITGMAIGGFVSSRPDPLAATSQYADGGFVETQPGVTTDFSGVTGFVPPTTGVPAVPDYSTFVPDAGSDPTQVDLDLTQFTPGFSTDTGVETSSATLYGPNGEVVTFILPTDQAQYDELLAQGYSTTPPMESTAPSFSGAGLGTAVTAQQDRDRSPAPQEDPEARKARMEAANLKKMQSMIDDPLAYGKAQLEGFTSKIGGRTGARIGQAVAGLPGRLIGGALGGLNAANNVADAMTSSEVAKSLGFDTTELDAQIEEYTGTLSKFGNFFSRNVQEKAQKQSAATLAAMRDMNVGGGIGRDKYASDKAFNTAMQASAPSGMTYVPTTSKKDKDQSSTVSGGKYVREGSAAPTTSPRPTARPSNLSTKKDKDQSSTTSGKSSSNISGKNISGKNISQYANKGGLMSKKKTK